MNWPLLQRLPSAQELTSSPGADLVLDRFLDYVTDRKVELYPAQEEAVLEIFAGKNVILNTPTGSGKSLVATALHFKSLSEGKRSIYTCPIKALVNEKFFSLCQDFGPDQVGMITGDASVNSTAPIICCTAEVLAQMALRDGSKTPIDDVVMDEFHYYSDRERGVAWQIPLLTLKNSRFLLMSATLGDTGFFEKELTRLTGKDTLLIQSQDRPVPLDFEYVESPLQQTVLKLIEGGKYPVYLVHFTQKECAEGAQNFLSIDFCTKDEKRSIANALEGVKFSSPYGKELQKLLKHGVGIHHAGLLPKYRILVEKLAQKGLLKLICGTDTLGVGVNVPIRTVLFTKLCKFDGEKVLILPVRDFQQISGRAGRRGFDQQGFVIAQAPEHVIENLKQDQKAAQDPKKAKKMVKKKPPEKGYVPWNKETFFKLVQGQPEALVSRFSVSHAMLLNVLSRGDEGCDSMRHLIRDCHESPNTKKRLGKTAFQIFRSLVEKKIIDLNPLRLNIDLQQDFSLNQTLSLYLIDTLKLLDPGSENYSLDLLTLVESILENPDLILRRQLDRIKREKLDELKMQGVEYEERIAELENLEYPKPNREFIYHTFNEFVAVHPWIEKGQETIRPKSIAREMYETFQSFDEYIREYGLQRTEGLLLRYLSEVYKTLVQTVPDFVKTDEVHAVIVYFGDMIKQIDSSLLDEWERLRNPNFVSKEVPGEAEQSLQRAKGQQEKLFRISVQNEVFKLLRALASRNYEGFIEGLNTEVTLDHLEKMMQEYYTDHQRICTDQKARGPKNFKLSPVQGDPEVYQIEQIIVDPEGHNDWILELTLRKGHAIDLNSKPDLGFAESVQLLNKINNLYLNIELFIVYF